MKLEEYIPKLVNEKDFHSFGSDSRNIAQARHNLEAFLKEFNLYPNKMHEYDLDFLDSFGYSSYEDVAEALKDKDPEIIIDVYTHTRDGKLYNFDKPANGGYIWTIDEDGKFIACGVRGDLMVEQGKIDGDIVMYLGKMCTAMPVGIGRKLKKEILDEIVPDIYHSFLCNGKRVFGSGEVGFKEGKILIDIPMTGHYFPGHAFKEQFDQQTNDVFNKAAYEIGLERDSN